MITLPTSVRRDTASTATTKTGSASSSSGTPAAATQPGGEMGKDQFMKLLIAQMQNQDPTNPMDGSQMASQLAQFSSLEQLQNINTTLTSQQSASGSLLGAVQANAAIGAIGHHVLAAGSDLELGQANDSTTVTADISATGKSATLEILDANGKVVGSRDLGAVAAGRQTFDIGSAGDGLSGKYTYKIDVKDSAGNAVSVQTYVTGKVNGVSSGANGLVLNVGGLTVPYANVVQITD